jgi:hypothetical protein
MATISIPATDGAVGLIQEIFGVNAAALRPLAT